MQGASQEEQNVVPSAADFELIDLARHRKTAAAEEVPVALQAWRTGTFGLALGLLGALVMMCLSRATNYVFIPNAFFIVMLISIGTLVLGYFDLLP